MPCSPTCCSTGCVVFLHSAGILNPSPCPASPLGINADPCNDLGGPPSPIPLSMGLNNLFHSIGPKLSRRGHEDYRCFYIYNSSSNTLRNVIIFLDGTGRQVPGKRGGTYVAIGVKLQDAIQQVIVSGPAPPNEGQYFELQVPCYDPSFKVYYDPNITKWIGNFQTAIRAVDGLPEVVVTGTGQIGTTLDNPNVNVTFTINFGGNTSRNKGHKGVSEHGRWQQAAKHNINLVEVVNNTLLNNIVTPMITQQGSPVNTIAEGISSETTPPVGIPFDYYFRGNPMRVGDLRPNEYLPVWVRRTLPIVDTYYGPLARNGQMAKLLDGFSIVVEGTSP